MSNRRRAYRPPLDLASVKAAKDGMRCPDCDSDVTVNRQTHQISIAHDDGCPALAALTRQGRLTQVALLRRPGQSAESFADDTLRLTAAVARHREEFWPGSDGLRVALDNPYTDLDFGAAP